MKHNQTLALLLSLALLLGACSNLPKEAVTLSYQVGTDTEVLHQSYRKLIRAHFEAVRQTYEAQWTEKVLIPYVKSYVKETRLADIIAGTIIWDASQEKFVAPPPGCDLGVEFANTMQAWSKEFSETTAGLKKAFMAPIEKAEANLTQSVDNAFAQIARGNAAVSAQLASLRRLQDAQDDVLDKAGVPDLRQKISDGLAKASDDAANLTARTESATSKIEELKKKLNIK